MSALRVLARPRALVLAAAVSAVALAAGCGGSSGNSGDKESMAGMHHTNPSARPSDMAGMDGMDDMPGGDGLSATSAGFTMKALTTMLPSGQATTYQFKIMNMAGKAVTSFETDQTKLMHFYLIRSDVTGFQHVHPTMAADGTWSAPIAATPPGSYRAYASFNAKNEKGKATPVVVSVDAPVAGAEGAEAAFPPPARTTTVDGYTVTASGDLMAGMSHTLTLTVAKGGTPVTNLEPYLDTYAHLTAFHEGDLAFAHLHPQGTVNGDHGGPTLTFEAMLPKPGNWRMFVQFQTAGVLHTAAITLAAAG
ncbi:MAG: hypothetical protein ACJ73S_04080 [Mycobacteriales bacterium]